MLYTIFTTYLYSWLFGVSKNQILKASQLPEIEQVQIEIKRTQTQKTSIELGIESK